MKIDLDAIDRASDVYVPGEQIRALVRCVRAMIRRHEVVARRAWELDDSGGDMALMEYEAACSAEIAALRECGLL